MPPLMITSLVRPTIRNAPWESITPTSPVRSQPSPKVSAVRVSSFQ
jgi:hypothetical protein